MDLTINGQQYNVKTIKLNEYKYMNTFLYGGFKESNNNTKKVNISVDFLDEQYIPDIITFLETNKVKRGKRDERDERIVDRYYYILLFLDYMNYEGINKIKDGIAKYIKEGPRKYNQDNIQQLVYMATVLRLVDYDTLFRNMVINDAYLDLENDLNDLKEYRHDEYAKILVSYKKNFSVYSNYWEKIGYDTFEFNNYINNSKPTIVSNISTFKKNFSKLALGILDDLNWKNIVVAGGCLTNSLSTNFNKNIKNGMWEG